MISQGISTVGSPNIQSVDLGVDGGSSLLELNSLILIELRILNQYMAELPFHLQTSGNYGAIPAPDDYRREVDLRRDITV